MSNRQARIPSGSPSMRWQRSGGGRRAPATLVSDPRAGVCLAHQSRPRRPDRWRARRRTSASPATPTTTTRPRRPRRAGGSCSEQTGVELEHVASYSFDPAILRRQHRAVHRRGAGADRARRPAAGQRRARPGRVLRAARHRRGHAGGQLQPRHEAAARGGRRDTHGDGRRDAARARVPVRQRARVARVRPAGSTRTSTRSRQAAETTTKSGKLRDIEKYSASRILYTRFNYTTGDAAGQNLTGKATAAACAWITSNYPAIERFFLESNFATDKKSSQVNMLRTRGKRVVAEATIPTELIQQAHAHRQREPVPGAPGVQPRRLHVGGQQQRRALGERDHRDVHRHRPGRGQRRRVLGRVRVRRAAARTATTTTRSRSRR